MKRVFLFTCIIISVSANAQRKELFDIDRHIQNGLQNKNTGILKQANLAHGFGKNSIAAGKSFTLPNGDKVISLPFSNMPCIITDMRQFQAMPNPGNVFNAKQRQRGLIPNGADRIKSIVF